MKTAASAHSPCLPVYMTRFDGTHVVVHATFDGARVVAGFALPNGEETERQAVAGECGFAVIRAPGPVLWVREWVPGYGDTTNNVGARRVLPAVASATVELRRGSRWEAIGTRENPAALLCGKLGGRVLTYVVRIPEGESGERPIRLEANAVAANPFTSWIGEGETVEGETGGWHWKIEGPSRGHYREDPPLEFEAPTGEAVTPAGDPGPLVAVIGPAAAGRSAEVRERLPVLNKVRSENDEGGSEEGDSGHGVNPRQAERLPYNGEDADNCRAGASPAGGGDGAGMTADGEGEDNCRAGAPPAGCGDGEGE